MAKTSKIVANNRRKETIERYAVRRAVLVAVIKDPEATYEEKRIAYQGIAKMPRDASATRYRNRCGQTGRPRGYFRKFGMSRNALRQLAHRGELPGVRKASW
ncbi:SSU ribosomal protein S14p (S29e) @ SSU ribosomal protein S14p (S29e), zinc-independent [hydrothermal vent metagenome]|uniref:SSU ribosomal protein S14p (S29e) @ SSU ribosomal protein S14p (S29e), zinc-independent n=1 Tax=hydrothermal vent metagenome TaxID=652676 RepID=A0A3B0SCL4_9ZZZZ